VPARHHFGAGGRGTVDETRHALELLTRHHWPHRGLGIEGVAGSDPAYGIGETGDEVVVDPGPGEHSARCGAVLAGVVVGTLDEVPDDRIEIGVVEHDDGRLPAQLQVHTLERVGRGARDRASGGNVAGE
jgi:hypothetical protein